MVPTGQSAAFESNDKRAVTPHVKGFPRCTKVLPIDLNENTV